MDFVKGEGFTIPQNNSGVTKWKDLRANLSIYLLPTETVISISGSGFSEFRNKEYFVLFNTCKNNGKYNLVKTLYKTNTGSSIPDCPQCTIVYKIINYDLDTLTFTLKGETPIHGEITGKLEFTRIQRGYRL